MAGNQIKERMASKESFSWFDNRCCSTNSHFPQSDTQFKNIGLFDLKSLSQNFSIFLACSYVFWRKFGLNGLIFLRLNKSFALNSVLINSLGHVLSTIVVLLYSKFLLTFMQAFAYLKFSINSLSHLLINTI
jgi:hypothetical protein